MPPLWTWFGSSLDTSGQFLQVAVWKFLIYYYGYIRTSPMTGINSDCFASVTLRVVTKSGEMQTWAWSGSKSFNFWSNVLMCSSFLIRTSSAVTSWAVRLSSRLSKSFFSTATWESYRRQSSNNLKSSFLKKSFNVRSYKFPNLTAKV